MPDKSVIKTDYDALRKSQANRPRMLALIDMAESAGIPVIESCEAPQILVVNKEDENGSEKESEKESVQARGQ